MNSNVSHISLHMVILFLSIASNIEDKNEEDMRKKKSVDE